ncbi:MAG: prolyl oligopeptidase family serine peptidase [Gammaproteobacteria bacterium]
MNLVARTVSFVATVVVAPALLGLAGLSSTACGSAWAQTSASIPPQSLAAPLAARTGTNFVTPDWLVTAARSASNEVMEPVWVPGSRALLITTASASGGQRNIERIDVRTKAHTLIGAGSHPLPSPDGRWIAYVHTENEIAQLWMMASGGGKARLLYSPLPSSRSYDVYGSLYSFAWSPDSRHVAIGLQLEPPWEKILSPGQSGDAGKTSAVEGVAATRTLPPDGEIWLVDVESGKTEQVLKMPGRITNVQWYRDGSAILFVTGKYASLYGTERDEFAVRALRIRDRQLRTIAAPAGMQQSLWPALSLDGSRVVFTYDGDHPLYDWQINLGLASASIPPQEVTSPSITRITREMQLMRAGWSPDGRTIYAIRRYGAYNQLYAIDSATGAVTQLTSEPLSVLKYAVSPDGRFMAWAGQNFQGRYTLKTASVRKNELKGVSEAMSVDLVPPGIALGEVREVEWRTPGFPNAIRGAVVMPVNYQPGRKYPLFIDMHGGGFSVGISPRGGLLVNTPLEWHLWAAKGYMVFVPDYRSSVQYGSFVVEQKREQQNELTADVADVMAGIDHLIAQGWVDEKRMVAFGHSAGGHRANWMAVTTHRFRGIVSKEGWADRYLDGGLFRSELQTWIMKGTPVSAPGNYLKESAIYHSVGATTPTLFVMGVAEHGGADRRRSVEWLHNSLKEQGVETRYVVYPDEGHVFTREANQRDMLSRVIPWVEAHLQ